MPQSVHAIQQRQQQQQQVLQQQLAQQRLQQAMQPQLGQVNGSANALQNQFQQQQLQQQLGALQQAARLSSGTSPVPIGAGQNGGFLGAQGGLASLGHLGPSAVNGQQNGIAALSQLAQHHQAVLGNGHNSSLSFQAMQQPKQDK